VVRKAVNAFMASPLAGLAPWILYALVSGPDRLELSVLIALAAALVIFGFSRLQGGSIKALELSDVIFFALLAIVVAVASDDLHDWLEVWSGEIANIALMLIVVGSIVLRRPFTLAYAKEDTPEEYWDTPEFMRVNYIISWVWAAAFIVEAASGAFGDGVLDNSNNLWTGWVIQTAGIIWAAQFTIFYQQLIDARTKVLTGEDPNARIPVWAELYRDMATWIAVAGILSLVFDGGPAALGIGLIAAGVIVRGFFSRKASAAKPRPAPA
jgi:hypothetical protein